MMKIMNENIDLIISIKDYLSLVSQKRKDEMIAIWGSLPAAVHVLNGEVIPVWEELSREASS